MNAAALLNAFKSRSFVSNRIISNNLIVFGSKILFKIRFIMFSWRILFKTSSLMTDKDSCSANRMFWLIERTNISLSRLKNYIKDETELTADETIFDLFDWSILSTCDALREVTETIFEIENLKTTAFVERIEMSVSIVSILLAVIEELLTKSLLKKAFIWKFFINFISLIIKSAARKFSRIDAERSE